MGDHSTSSDRFMVTTGPWRGHRGPEELSNWSRPHTGGRAIFPLKTREDDATMH